MTDEFNIKGEWFLPSSRDVRIPGTLNYHPREGTTLELYGNFEEVNFPPEFNQKIILGFSVDSKQVVLYNCNMTKSGGATFVSREESRKPSVSYSIGFILIGLHVDNLSELKFDKISCEIFNLGEWVGISGFKNDLLDYNNYEIQVSYKLPESIEFLIDNETNGKINFIADYPRLSRYQKSISINQKVEFQAITKTDKSIEELLTYVLSFQNFLILALYRSTYPLAITLSGEKHKKDYGNDIIIKKDVKLYFSSSNFKENEKPILDFEMLFNYGQIKDIFPTLIKNWFLKYELLKPAFGLVFEQFYRGNRFNENTFLNLAQSAETFHARTHNHTRIPKQEYKVMKDEILKLVPNEYHSWLIDQFNFGNNLNLHTRLTEIIEKYSNEILDELIGDKKAFVLYVKNSRNYYTHYSSDGKKKALKGYGLFYLSEKLKILLVCSFLMEIGFKKDLLTSSLNNVKWTLFNHLTNLRDKKLN